MYKITTMKCLNCALCSEQNGRVAVQNGIDGNTTFIDLYATIGYYSSMNMQFASEDWSMPLEESAQCLYSTDIIFLVSIFRNATMRFDCSMSLKSFARRSCWQIQSSWVQLLRHGSPTHYKSFSEWFLATSVANVHHLFHLGLSGLAFSSLCFG